MSDKEPVAPDADITKAWAASQDQKASAKKLRTFAGLSWLVAIGTEIAAIVFLLKGKFNDGNLALLSPLLQAASYGRKRTATTLPAKTSRLSFSFKTSSARSLLFWPSCRSSP